MLDCSVDDSILLMSYYTYFIHTIYLLWLESNGEVHCKRFYSGNVMKEVIFCNGGEASWSINIF